MAKIENQRKLRVLVTGAGGFVGSALCAQLQTRGHSVRCATRHPSRMSTTESTIARVTVGELGPETDWSAALTGVSIVFHLAARTHVMHETARDVLAAYRRVNVEGTKSLTRAALDAGVCRIVFVSSIKVTGERTDGFAYTEATPPQPEDAYGVSKWEAEQSLREITSGTPLETVIIRPPLVYGPGVKGNFLRLMHWVKKGVPLPLGSIRNRRSLIYVDNLADAIATAGVSPRAANQTYLVSDGEDVSTPELIRAVAQAMGVAPRLYRFPPGLLTAAARIIGAREQARRLIDGLQIDSGKIRSDLNWQPHFNLAQGLARTAQWYHSRFSIKSNT